MKKYIITTCYILAITYTSVVYGQMPTQPVTGEYTVLAPLPGTTKNCTGSGADLSCTADINSYLSGFLNLVIGIGAVMSMLYIGYYGLQYSMSDSASVKNENRDKLWETLQGLLLIISAYAIMYTINPALVKNLSLQLNSPKLNAPVVNLTTTIGNGASTGALVINDPTKGKYNANGVYYNDCGAGMADSCKTIASTGLDIGVGNRTLNGGSVTTQFSNQLVELNKNTPLIITEAWPPSRNHGAPCHKDGTCVDAVPKGVPMNTSNVIKLITDARKTGAGAVFESNNPQVVKEVKAQLRSAGLSEDYALYLPTCSSTYKAGSCITAPHFSIYNTLKYN